MNAIMKNVAVETKSMRKYFGDPLHRVDELPISAHLSLLKSSIIDLLYVQLKFLNCQSHRFEYQSGLILCFLIAFVF